MVSEDRWKSQSSLTIRHRMESKSKLLQETVRSIPVGKHIREILARAKLPEKLLAELPPGCRENRQAGSVFRKERSKHVN